uniref:Uncharacterized protein n=1 Tax=Oryza punctata TaxID=4537 RepID=A0A0E0LZ39_ORYPU
MVGALGVVFPLGGIVETSSLPVGAEWAPLLSTPHSDSVCEALSGGLADPYEGEGYFFSLTLSLYNHPLQQRLGAYAQLFVVDVGVQL